MLESGFKGFCCGKWWLVNKNWFCDVARIFLLTFIYYVGYIIVVPPSRIELPTPPLPMVCSTTEL